MNKKLCTDTDDAAALASAIRAADVQAVRILLENGCDPNQTIDSLRMTPLHLVAQISTKANEDQVLEIANLLFNCGAKVLEDKSGQTPVHFAFYRENFSLISQLFSQIPEDAQFTDLKELSLLHIVCLLGVDQLVTGLEAHHMQRMISILLRQGADVNNPTTYGQTALHLACRFSDESIVTMLLEKGADLEAKDKNGLTPLLYACSDDPNYKHCSKILANTRDFSESVSNVLHIIHNLNVMKRRKRNIKYILQQGAAINVTGPGGKRVLHLLSETLTTDNILTAVEIAEILLHHGAHVNARDEKSLTPLHYVALESSARHEEFVKTLLEHGADINARDAGRRTPVSIFFVIYNLLSLENAQARRRSGDTLRVFQQLLLHAQCLMALGAYVTKETKTILQRMLSNKLVNSIQGQCTHELEFMKAIRVDDDTTLYRVLEKGRIAGGQCLDDDRLKWLLRHFNVAQNFPHYCSFLKSQVVRARLLVQAEEVLKLLAKCELPSLCCESILDYLDLPDFECLIAVGRPVDDQGTN